MRTSMLLLASGRGSRFGGETPKVFVRCRGKTLLRRSLERLAAAVPQGEREIVLATHPDDRERHVEPHRGELLAAGLTRIVDGGATRLQSMRNALAASDSSYPLVLVHDAARPFAPIDAIRAVLRAADETGAALLATPVPDTLKRGDARQRVVETVDRTGIWAAQTPQVIRRELLLRALAASDASGAAAGAAVTDDVALVERIGGDVVLVEGGRSNIKVTTPDDMRLAEWIAQQEDET